MQKHYICLGGCEGVSENPGVCQALDCENHKHALVECDCVDGEHNDFEPVVETKDLEGNILQNGDSVVLTKELKVKGSSLVLKKGTVVKNIRLTGNEEEIECRVDGMKGIVLRTEFLRIKK